MLAGLGALLLACSVIHVYLLATTYGSRFDLEAYSLQAFAATHRLNVYEYTARYPYPPVWIWIAGAVAELAPLVGLPFHIAIKMPATLADLAIVVLLFEYVRSRRGWVVWTLVPAGLYALNPVPALISAAHGQFDSLPVLFMLLALHLRDRPGNLDIAALSLGVAIALKAYPGLLLPYLALTAPVGRKVRTFGLALVPIGVAAVIYILAVGYSPAMFTHVAGYISTTAMGWKELISDLGIPVMVLLVLWIGSLVLMLVYATLVPWLVFGKRAILATASVFAFFYTTLFQGGIQYLVWGLPFFCLATTIGTIVYSLSATAMLLAFYAKYDPTVLPNDLPAGTLAMLQAGYAYRAALVIGSSALVLLMTLVKNQSAKRTSISI